MLQIFFLMRQPAFHTSRSEAHQPVQFSGHTGGSFRIADRRPQAAVQRQQVMGISPRVHRVQTEPLPAYAGDPPVQRVTLKRIQDPGHKSPFNESTVQQIENEVYAIVASAEQGKGEEHDMGISLSRLKELLKQKEVQKTFPKDSRGTYGLGGSNYLSSFTTVQGSPQFLEAITGNSNGKVEDLGSRSSGFHDEMHQISEYPGLHALLSTQGHCLFCYGLIHQRGYEHGTIRDNPWPQVWTHDYKGFTLRLVGEKSFYEFPSDPIILIKTKYWGDRYYRITDK